MDELQDFSLPKSRSLEMMSIEELRENIVALEAEIVATKAMIEKKMASKQAADAFFAKSS